MSATTYRHQRSRNGGLSRGGATTAPISSSARMSPSPSAAPGGRGAREGDFAGSVAHARFSSAFVRVKDTAEMVAMMRKMMIEIALARP